MQFLYTFCHIGANNIYTVQIWYIQYHLQPCVSQTMTSLKTSAYSDCGVLWATNPIDESNLVYQKKRKEKKKMKSAGAWCYAQNIQNKSIRLRSNQTWRCNRNWSFSSNRCGSNLRRPTGSQHHQPNLETGCHLMVERPPPPPLLYIPAGHVASAWFGVDAA